MLRPTKLTNKYQKRLIRPLYAQTQATPYAATLDPSLRNTDGSFKAPLSGVAVNGETRTADAFLLKGGLVPGTVMLKGPGENVQVAGGTNVATRPFGLLANFVGGELDDLGTENFVGVWRGPDSVFELLAPAFLDTSLASAYSSATSTAPVRLYAAADGRLATAADTSNGSAGNQTPVATLIERVSQSRIVVSLDV